MKSLYPLLPLLLLSTLMHAQSTINFDQDWKFHLGHATDPAKDFNFGLANIFSKTGKAEDTPMEVKFDAGGWRTVQLPHDWAVELPFENSPSFDVMAHGYKPVGGAYPQNSIGWYRKEFSIARADSGQRFSIQFDGIFRDSKIWINGFYLGNNQSGYLGVSYDITDYIRFDEKNVITVRVDATQYEGWFYEGAGIYRHAWLKKTNNIHIDRDKYFIHTATKKREGRIELQVQVACTNSGGPIVLYSYVTDRDGRVVASKPEHELTPYPGDTRSFPEVINLTNARPWTLQDPYLYRVVTVIKSGGNVLDSIKTRVGIRTIVINPTDGLFLNDEQIKIKGVCCHQDHAGVGSALPDYLQYYRIRLLKEMGANAYRTSHNAPTPELLDACDSLGMLVLDENRLLNSSPEYKNQYERLLIRDRNHPCVFMWSIGNEEGYVQTNGVGKRIAQSLMQVQKELDPFRTCTYAADVGNVYGGINEIIPVRGFNYRITGIEPYHHDHPGQPVVGTEMGSTVTTRGIYEKDTVRCYLPDEDLTAPWWANKAEEWWPIAASHNWMMGGFVWTGFDYRGEPTPFQWPNINSHFGIMDMCGFPKNIYYYYQSVWTTKPMVHIAQHWNWAGQSGRPTDVWVNSNLPEVELFLNGKSLGRKTKPQYGHLQWSVPFQPGKLEAVATGPGNQTVKTVVETTGAPSKLVLTPDRTALIANGQDATVVNITVLDQEGREVPDAANLIKCTATGSATLIGAGNGDPSSHEPDQYPDGKYQRRLFNGKCQFILRSTNKPGPIHLQFTSDNLPPATLDLKAN